MKSVDACVDQIIHHRSQVSIVVPMCNEETNVADCYDDIVEALTEAGLDYEIIFVDDGSSDGTAEAARGVIEGDGRACLIELRRNYGQAPALVAGFDGSSVYG